MGYGGSRDDAAERLVAAVTRVSTARVILVDGKELAHLLIDHGVGVTVAREYRVKSLDLDYFVTEDEGVAGDFVKQPFSS